MAIFPITPDGQKDYRYSSTGVDLTAPLQLNPNPLDIESLGGRDKGYTREKWSAFLRFASLKIDKNDTSLNSQAGWESCNRGGPSCGLLATPALWAARHRGPPRCRRRMVWHPDPPRTVPPPRGCRRSRHALETSGIRRYKGPCFFQASVCGQDKNVMMAAVRSHDFLDFRY